MKNYIIRMHEVYQRWWKKVRNERFRREHIRRLARIEVGLMGDVEPVGEGVHELRYDIGQGFRVYFTFEGDDVIILLTGSSSKKDQPRAIRVAIKLKKDEG